MQQKTQPTIDDETSRLFETYTEYSKTLRAWFVAYGIGGPVLLFTQQSITDKLAAAPERNCVVYMFLAGVASQIIIAMLNKWLNWHGYAQSINPPATQHLGHALAKWLLDQFWIDVICDVVSLVAFGLATMKVLVIVLR